MLDSSPLSRRRSASPSGRETAATPDDHRALRLWLRLLTRTQLIERRIRNELRVRFATALPRTETGKLQRFRLRATP